MGRNLLALRVVFFSRIQAKARMRLNTVPKKPAQSPYGREKTGRKPKEKTSRLDADAESPGDLPKEDREWSAEVG